MQKLTYHGQNVIFFFRKLWGCRPDQRVNFLFNRSDISQPTSSLFCVLLYQLTSPVDQTLSMNFILEFGTVVCRRAHKCLIYLIYVCLRIVVSNTFCIVFWFVCFFVCFLFFFVFVLCLVYPMLLVSLDCPFLIALRYFLTFMYDSVDFHFIYMYLLNKQMGSFEVTRYCVHSNLH